MPRPIGLVLLFALFTVACGTAQPDVGVAASSTSSATVAPASSTTVEATTTTTAQATTTSVGHDLEERKGELELALGFIHATFSLDPNNDEYTCMTADEVLAISPEQIEPAELAVTVTLMCMPEQFLAAQLELHETTYPDATEGQLVALECVLRKGVAEQEGLDLDERIALDEAGEMTSEVLDDIKSACDLTDEDLDALQQL